MPLRPSSLYIMCQALFLASTLLYLSGVGPSPRAERRICLLGIGLRGERLLKICLIACLEYSTFGKVNVLWPKIIVS